MELPPRARRIHDDNDLVAEIQGTTSACAENTPRPEGRSANPWNYLRVRGEYLAGAALPPNWPELPPRARRIPHFTLQVKPMPRTTSACAENTLQVKCNNRSGRNYLRVRGEYAHLGASLPRRPELPPRARRIQSGRVPYHCCNGTTSACAENTVQRRVGPAT